MQVFGEPGSRLRNVDKAVLDGRGLRVQAHDLVGCRLIAIDSIATIPDQLLDQLRARSLVLDQHDSRIEQALLVADRALECGIFEPPAEYMEQKEVFAFHAPSRAHGVVAELGGFVGGIPALYDAVE